MEKITVVVVDDHPLIQEAVRSLLAEREDIELVGEGTTGEHVFSLVEAHAPDILILDLGLPQRQQSPSGKFQYLEALATLNRDYPGTSVIILSQYLHQSVVQSMIEYNVRGYLLKSDNLSLNLPEAIATVHQGGVFFSTEFSKELFGGRTEAASDSVPTERQRAVLLAIAQSPNASYSEIAEQLGITDHTVKAHLKRSFQALGVGNLTAALIRAMQLNLIPFAVPDNGPGIVFGGMDELLESAHARQNDPVEGG